MYYLGMAQRRLQPSAESWESLQRALALNLRGDLAAEARRILAEKQGGSTFWIANGNARP
jgi:hypothetical protein